MDTKYLHAALAEYLASGVNGVLTEQMSVADLSIGELSNLLRRAQELKDAAAAARAEEGAGEPAEESARRTR